MLGHTGNKQAVRVLLEFILVSSALEGGKINIWSNLVQGKTTCQCTNNVNLGCNLFSNIFNQQ